MSKKKEKVVGKFIIAKPIYVTLIKKEGKWFPQAKLEGTDSVWSLMDTSGDMKKGKYFEGFQHYGDAKEVAMQYSKMLNIPLEKPFCLEETLPYVLAIIIITFIIILNML